MFPSGALGNRGNIIWSAATANGFNDRTLLRVFANAGEYILVSSSAVDVDDGDIEIFDSVSGRVAAETLGTSVFSCVAQRTANPADANRGFINTRTEELAGPLSINGTGNPNSYEPCYYQAPSTGVYYVAMYGPLGSSTGRISNGNSGVEPNITTLNTGTNQGTGISAWDVTVRDSQSSTTDLTGRLHTFYITMNMGDNGRQLHSDLYPITTDGYQYEIDIRGLDPFGFRVYGNQLGNLNSDGLTPLYGDVLGSNGSISNPLGNTSSAPPQFPIFFNTIDSAVIPYLPVYHPVTGNERVGASFSSSPVLPTVSAPSYSGDAGGNTSTVNVGGTFTFSSNLPTGNYQIVISRDGVDFDPANPDNRVLRGFMLSSGGQTVSWNGQDNTSQPFPVGTFNYQIQIHGGEYHFPISDAENNTLGGPTYELLNTAFAGNRTAFYDHRGYYTSSGVVVEDRDTGDGNLTDDALCGDDPPSPPATDLFAGADSSSSTFNVFGQASGGNTNARCTGAFGDTKILDLWTYIADSTSVQQLIIVDAASLDYGDAPDTSTGTGTGDYTTVATNDGPSHTLGGTTLTIGASVTADTGTAQNTAATADTDDAFTGSLASVPSTGTYEINNIPVQNAGSTDATLHGWIDFDRNGRFEADEYASATVTPTTTTANLSWTVPSDASDGDSIARFRLTTSTLVDTISSTSNQDERSVGRANDGEVEDYFLSIGASNPSVLLVKRITAINGGTDTVDGHDLSQYRDESAHPYDDNTIPPISDPSSSSYDPTSSSFDPNETNLWPTPLSTTLVGGTNGGTVVPDDMVEYTIYFLSAGDTTAEEIRFCDYIPGYTDFLANSFNGNSGSTGSLSGADLSIEIFQNGSSSYHTGADDGDAVVYFPPGVDPASDSRFTDIDCEGDGNSSNSNPNGAIAVDLGDITNASSATTSVADESYGYVRFRARVK